MYKIKMGQKNGKSWSQNQFLCQDFSFLGEILVNFHVFTEISSKKEKLNIPESTLISRENEAT